MDAQTVERLEKGMAFEKSRTGPPAGFPCLPPIPGGRYVDPDFLEAERKGLWSRAWLYAAHTDELPEPGSYKLWRRSGSPILIIRGQDSKIRAFYNTCQHRGAPLVKDNSGHVKGLVCGYHGWTYNLTGELLRVRDKRDFVGLDMKCRSLIEVRCELFGNWIFVSENPDAPPLLDYLGPIPSHLEQFQIDQLRLVESASYDVECNVKVMQDAFLEVYHLKSIHKNTVDRFLDYRGSNIVLWPNGHSLMLTPNRRPDWVDPGAVGMPDTPTVNDLVRYNNPSYNFFPNLVVPVAATGMPFLLFWPTGPRSMCIEVHWFSPDWGEGPRSTLWDTRIANFERILDEDTQFGPQIQESVESPGFRGVPLSYQERRIYHWHEELDRRIGIDKVPPNLRVTPMLSNWIES